MVEAMQHGELGDDWEKQSSPLYSSFVESVVIAGKELKATQSLNIMYDII